MAFRFTPPVAITGLNLLNAGLMKNDSQKLGLREFLFKRGNGFLSGIFVTAGNSDIQATASKALAMA